MTTPQFSRYIQPARRRPQLWRLVAGVLVIVVSYAVGIVLLLWLVSLVEGARGLRATMAGLSSPSTPRDMVILFATFPGAGLGAMIAARLLHGRPVASLFGRASRLMRDFVRALGVMAVFAVVYLSIWSLFHDAIPNLGARQWLAVLPLSLVLLLLQTGTEEIVFRGYLQQQLAARFRSPVVWMILPSLGFAALHYDPALRPGENLFLLSSAGVFGLAAADLTRVTGNLGTAWGFHFANNFLALAILALNGSMTGFALFVTPYDQARALHSPVLMASDLLATVLVWAVLRRLAR